jgi:hypothetical protein
MVGEQDQVYAVASDLPLQLTFGVLAYCRRYILGYIEPRNIILYEMYHSLSLARAHGYDTKIEQISRTQTNRLILSLFPTLIYCFR